MNKLIVLLLALVAVGLVSAEGTLKTNYVFPSATTSTLIHTLIGNEADADVADVNTLNITPTMGMVIDTSGPITFDASFVSLQSSTNTIISSGGDINVDATSSGVVRGNNLNIFPEDDFIFSSNGGETNVISHGGLVTYADEQWIRSSGQVDINAGAGPIDIFSDDIFGMNGVNVDIWAENRLSIFAQHTLTASAGEEFNVITDIVDFDSTSSFTVTSTTSNVNFVAGNQFITRAGNLEFVASEGIDIESIHGSVEGDIDGDINAQGLDVNFQAYSDSNFLAINGNINLEGNNLNGEAVRGTYFNSDVIDQNASTVEFDSMSTFVSPDDHLVMTVSSNVLMAADQHAEMATSDLFVLANNDISFETTDGSGIDSNVIFQAMNEDDSFAFFETIVSDINISADDDLSMSSGSTYTLSNDYEATGTTFLGLLSNTDSLDSIETYAADNINIEGSNIVSFGEYVYWGASDIVQFEVNNGNLTFAAGSETEELFGVFAGNDFDMNVGSAAFLSTLDMLVESEDFISNGDSFIIDSQGDVRMVYEEDMVITGSSFVAFSADEAYIEAKDIDMEFSEDFLMDGGDNLIVWGNNDASFFSVDAQWESVGDINFQAFESIIIENLQSVSVPATACSEGSYPVVCTHQITVTNGTNPSQITWNIYENGVPIAGGGVGVTLFDINDGNVHTIAMADFAGDGWNGATYTIISVATGMVEATGTLDNGFFGEDYLQLHCTDSGVNDSCMMTVQVSGTFKSDQSWAVYQGTSLLFTSSAAGTTQIPVIDGLPYSIEFNDFSLNGWNSDVSYVITRNVDNAWMAEGSPETGFVSDITPLSLTCLEEFSLPSVQCDYYISISSGSWASEVSWELYEEQNLIVSGGAPFESSDFTINQAFSHSLYMFDSFGDGWNGALYSLIRSQDNFLVVQGTLESGYSGVANFILPCTDSFQCQAVSGYTLEITSGSWNSEVSWNLLAGSTTLLSGGAPMPATALPSLASNTILTMEMFDSFGDGWNGSEYIFRDGDGIAEVTGTLEDGYSGQDNFILGCASVCNMTVTVSSGYFPSIVSWSILQNGVSILSGGANETAGFTFKSTYTYTILLESSVSNLGWGGAFYQVTRDLDGMALSSGTLSIGVSDEENLYLSCPTSASSSVNAGCQFNIMVTEGNWPTEVSWNLLENGATLISGGAPDNMNFTIDESLSHQIAMFDSFGDGWNSANYTITRTMDSVVAAIGGLTDGYSGTDNLDLECVPDFCSVSLTITAGTWESEISWSLTQTGASGTITIASGGAPAQFPGLQLQDTATYTMNMMDSFGDGWNGATYSFTRDSDDSLMVTGTLVDGYSGSDIVPVSCDKCTPDVCSMQIVVTPSYFSSEIAWVIAENGNPLAFGGSPSQSTFEIDSRYSHTIVMFDSFGDGWDIASYEILRVSDNVSMASGTLTDGYFESDTLALYCEATSPYECGMNIYVTLGIFNSEVSWDVYEDSAIIASGGTDELISFSVDDRKTHAIHMFDSFGDGWDLSDYIITRDSDNAVQATGTLVDGYMGIDSLDLECSTGYISFEAYNYIDVRAGDMFFNTANFEIASGNHQDIDIAVESFYSTAIAEDITSYNVFLNGEFVAFIGSADDFGIVNIESNNGDDVSFFSDDVFTETNGLMMTADVEISMYVTDDLLFGSANNTIFKAWDSHYYDIGDDFLMDASGFWNVTSGMDITLEADSPTGTGGGFFGTGPVNFNAARDMNVTTGGDLMYSVTGDIVMTSPYISFDNTGNGGIEDSLFGVQTGGDVNFNVTQTGGFTVEGGSTALNFTGTFSVAAADRASLNSIFQTTITTEGNFYFNAPHVNDSIRFESFDFVATADAGDALFKGGNITIQSGEAQPIWFSTTTDLYMQTNNGMEFTWMTGDDLNTTAGGYYITSNDVNSSNGAGITFTTTHEMGDFVALVRDGELLLKSRDTQWYNGGRIELFAAADMNFATSLALQPNTGGITFTTQGLGHDPIYGDDLGILMRTSGNDGVLYMQPLLGALTFNAQAIDMVSEDGWMDVLADAEMTFYTTDGGIEITSEWGWINMLADNGDVTFTSPLDTEIQASGSIYLSALNNIFLTASTSAPLNAANNLAFEFSVNTGDIKILADSDEDISWYANQGIFFIQTGERTEVTASENILYTAATGQFVMNGHSGLSYWVRNGDLQLTASDNIHTSSGDNWWINVYSGQDSLWTAQSGEITITSNGAYDQLEPLLEQSNDQMGIMMRSQRENVTFQAVTGDINMQSTGMIRFQSDGTNDNIAGNDEDGIFFDAIDIDFYADDVTIWESQGQVVIGANTNPVITFEAGGDTRGFGLSMSSEGNANVDTQGDMFINSGGYFATTSYSETDFTAGQDIAIASTGVSPVGKNVEFMTNGEMDINGDALSITGQDSVFLTSDGVMSLRTTGTNGQTSYMDISVTTDLVIDVNRTTDVNTGTFDIVASDSYNMVATGYTKFSAASALYFFADSLLSFDSDVHQTWTTTGANADITFSTTGSNQDINVQTYEGTSDIIFMVDGTFSALATDEISFLSTHSISITSEDNILSDGVETGSITLTAAEDFTLDAGRNLILDGAQGLSVSTTNSAGSDIEFDVTGYMYINSWEDMLFNTTNGDMTIDGQSITLATAWGQQGDITVGSTEDLEYSVGTDWLATAYGDAFMTAGRSFEWIASGALSYTLNSVNGVITGASQAGPATFAAVGIDGIAGDAYFSASGAVTVSAGADMNIETEGQWSDIEFWSSGLMTLNAADDLSVLAGELDPYIPGTILTAHNGHAWYSAYAGGAHPTLGYGMLINVADDVHIDTQGFTSFVAPKGRVSITSTTGEVKLEGDNYLTPMKPIDNLSTLGSMPTEGNAIEIVALAPGAHINVTSIGGSIAIGALGDVHIQSTGGVVFDSYDDIEIDADGSGEISPWGVEFITDHPYSDIVIYSTDFLDGDIFLDATGEVDLYGEFGVKLHLQDDDDQDTSGLFTMDAVNIHLSSENDVLIGANGGGDISALGSDVWFTAGGDILCNVRQVFDVDSDDTSLEAVGSIIFSSSAAEELQFSASSTMTLSTNDALLAAGNIDIDVSTTITWTAGDGALNVSPAYADIFISSDAGTVILEGNNVVMNADVIDIPRGMKIPFIFARDNNNNFARVSTGHPCSPTNGNFKGAAGSLFWEPLMKQLCYCTEDGVLACAFGRTVANYNYLP